MAKPRKSKRRKKLPPAADVQVDVVGIAAEQQARADTFPSTVHAFKPGESGNIAGRPPNAGSSVLEWVNKLAAADLGEDDLRRVARDRAAPWRKRTAALRMLRTMECGDIADFQPLLNGRMDLVELRDSGVNTELVKKFKVKTHTEMIDEEEVEIVERELELHDRSGDDFDRILDRTNGRARQTVEVEGAGGVPLALTVEVVGMDGAGGGEDG